MKNVLKKFSLVLCIFCLVLLVGCKDKEVDPVELGQPTNVAVSESYVLTWDAVPNASSYLIRIGANTYTSTTNSIDLSKVLTEGQNFVFVEAVGDKKNYLDSDASFIQIDYTRYTPEQFRTEVKEVLTQNGGFVTDQEIDDTVEILNNAIKKSSVKKEDSLKLLSFVTNFYEANSFKEAAKELKDLKALEYDEEEIADFTYEVLMATLNKEIDNGNAEAKIIKTLLSSEDATIKTIVSSIYSYAVTFGEKYILADNKYESSSKTDADEYTYYKEVVEAVFNEDRPTKEEIVKITNSIETTLNLGEVAGIESKEIKAIIDVLDLIEETYEPLMDATYKLLTVLSVDQFSALNDSVKLLVEELEEGITWENKNEIEDAIQIIKVTLEEVNVDIDTEITLIESAWKTFENSDGYAYLEELINDLLEEYFGTSITLQQLKDVIDMIINSDEDTALSVLVSSALDILELPEDLKTIINEVVVVYEEYEKNPTTEDELINDILDKLTNDQTITDLIDKSEYKALIDDIIEELRTYDSSTSTTDDLLASISDKVLRDEGLKSSIKEEVSTTLTEEEKAELKNVIDDAIIELNAIMDDNQVLLDEVITAIENMTEADIKVLLPSDTDYTEQISFSQIELIYDVLVYYQEILK